MIAASAAFAATALAAGGSASAADHHTSTSHQGKQHGHHANQGDSGDDPRAAQNWFVNQRLTLGVKNPATYAAAEQAAMIRVQQSHAARPAVAAGISNPVWQSLGPQPLNDPNPSFSGSVTVPAQKVSGRVMTIATSGSGATEQALLGSAGGGVWSTTLSSSTPTWNPLTDFQPSLALGAVAVAPSNSQVIYAGTGEDDQGSDSFYGQGLLVSTNGGANWADYPGGAQAGKLAGATFSAVAVDPANPAHVYLATSLGFFSSTNSGFTLTGPSPASNVAAMVVDPVNFSIVYIAVPGVGIEESTNGGSSFAVLSGGLPAAASIGNAALAISPKYGTDNTVYVEISNCANYGSCPAGTTVWKTTNGGTSWINTNAPDVTVQTFYYGAGGSNMFDQGFYDLAIAVDPANTSVVYVAGIGISVSLNGGTSWSGSGAACQSAANGCALGDFTIHPDNHSLVFDSTGNLLIGNDGGVYELPAAAASTGNAGTDATPNYVDLNTNLSTLQMYPGGTQAGDATSVLAGTQDNGPDLYTGSQPWTVVGEGGDGGYNLIDSSNTSVQYSTSDGSLVATTNGWSTTSGAVTTPNVASANFVPPIALGNSATTLGGLTVYYGGEQPYKSVNGGQTWTDLTGSYIPATPSADQNDVSAIAVAPTNPLVVYCAWGDGTLQVSSDGGTTWHTITPTALENGTDFWVTHIAVDPNNAAHILVTFSGFTFPQSSPSQPHLVETTNALVTTPVWTDDSGSGLPGVPTNSVIFDQSTTGTSYIVATDVGVYSTSTLTGASTVWSPLGANLPLAQVEDVSLSADGSTLLAFTHGRGAWKLSLPTVGNELIISQVRFSGPSGANDSYVDLYNTGPTTVNLTGWKLHYEASGGTDVSISLPSAGNVPAHGYYLVAGSAYSLGTTAAADDSPGFAPPSTNTGVELIAPNSTVADAVGLSGAAAAYKLGGGLPNSLSVSSATANYVFARTESSGSYVNTQNNATDFLLLDPAVGLAGSARGAPYPENSTTAPVERTIAYSTLIDPTLAEAASPNQTFTAGSPGTLTVSRTITNTSTNLTITALYLRMTSMSVQGGPGVAGHAQLRIQNATAGSVVTTCCSTVATSALTLVGPSQPNGGGIDSVLQVTLPGGGLAPGASVSVSFTFLVDAGGTFWFNYDTLTRP
jgi:hypothetical protein